jgi:hypothetical protein
MAGEMAAIPCVADVKAIVIGEQHRQRAGFGDAAGGGQAGAGPLAVIEGGGGFGIVLAAGPVVERGQGDGQGAGRSKPSVPEAW